MAEQKKKRVRDYKAQGLIPVEQRTLIVPDNRLYRLYEKRKGTDPTAGQRSRPNLAVILILLVFMLLSLGSIAWTERSAQSKLQSISGVNILQDTLSWTVRGSGEVDCAIGDKACYNELARQPELYSGSNLANFSWHNNTKRDDLRWFLLNTALTAEGWQGLGDESVWVFSLPRFDYENLWVYFDGQLVRQFFKGEKVGIPFRSVEGRQMIRVDLVLSQEFRAEAILPQSNASDLSFVGTKQGYDEFQQHLAVMESASGNKLRSLARVVLAVFCIFLFLFVDSSPESLALAVFMGLKGVGVGVAQGWISEWLPGDYRSATTAWIFCYADVMQLYFFAQLSRLARPNIWPWLAGSCIVSTVYVLPIVFDMNDVLGTVGIAYGKHSWALRSAGLGLCCWVFAALAIASVWPQRLYWRLSALVVASLGVVVQVVTPLASYFPEFYHTDGFWSFYYVLETHTPYVFALSTFINISTLEARVKSLSLEVAEAREIEKEMALGQTVQRSFMQTPDLPGRFGFTYHNEAAVYVSGDIFFVNWDEEQRTLTAILNDVTGHGIQAALKASICTAIAESIWAGKQIRDTDDPLSKLEIYDRRLHSFMDKISEKGEVVSIVGFEFDERANVIRLYRVHGVFPIVVSRLGDGSGYEVHVMPIKNRQRYEVPWQEDSFVLLISDGFVDSSRTMRRLQKHLTQSLGRQSLPLNESDLREIFFRFGGFETVADDRTILILHRRFADARSVLIAS